MWKLVLPLLIAMGAFGAWTCMNRHVPEIEAELTSRTIRALVEAGIVYDGNERVYFKDTLVAHLRGYPGSREISPEAQDIAFHVFGVSSVTIEEIPDEEGPGGNQPAQRPAATADPAMDRINEVLKLDIVEFVSDESVLTSEGKATLDKIASILIKSTGAFEVQGHSDATGQAEKNRALSRRRAETARAYLISKGIAPGRLKAVGYGPDRPIDDNGTPEGRRRNRRIEFSRQEAAASKVN